MVITITDTKLDEKEQRTISDKILKIVKPYIETGFVEVKFEQEYYRRDKGGEYVAGDKKRSQKRKKLSGKKKAKLKRKKRGKK